MNWSLKGEEMLPEQDSNPDEIFLYKNYDTGLVDKFIKTTMRQ
jgi:hypothetical protein